MKNNNIFIKWANFMFSEHLFEHNFILSTYETQHKMKYLKCPLHEDVIN